MISLRNILYHILISGSLFFIFIACSNTRQPEIKFSDKNNLTGKKGTGKIVFVKEIHNFGNLNEGEIVSFNFVFRNEGRSSLQIVKAEKSCGCIEIKYPLSPISPGKSAALEVIFNTGGEWGNQIKEVSVETSDGERKALQIGAYIVNKQFNNLLNTQQ